MGILQHTQLYPKYFNFKKFPKKNLFIMVYWLSLCMLIEMICEFNTVKIYIDKVLHIQFKKDSWVGTQAWLEGKGKYCIEYYFESRSILTEYDSKEKWLAILNKINAFKF